MYTKLKKLGLILYTCLPSPIEKMRKLRFCANLTYLFKEQEDILDRYETAKGAGFQGVEIANPYDIPREQVKAKLDDIGLEQILINGHPGRSGRYK